MRYSTPITILVAEDDADDRLMILEAFEESRVANRVDFVVDGEEMLQYLRREGEFGRLHVHIENVPSENPKTGKLTAMSIIRSVQDVVDPVRIGT